MKTISYVPNSLRSACNKVRRALARSLERLPHEQFVRVWSPVAYLFPNMHPDGFDDADNGWPRVLKRFAAEAWLRVAAGELAAEQLYPSGVTWCGIYDRMYTHKPDEIERRHALAADHGESAGD